MIVCLSCNCKTQTATDAYKQRLNTHTHTEIECMCVSLWGLLSRRFVCMNKSWRLIRNLCHGISAPVVAVVVAHNCSMSRCRCQSHEYTSTHAHTNCMHTLQQIRLLVYLTAAQLALKSRTLSLSLSVSSLPLSLPVACSFSLFLNNAYLINCWLNKD